MVKQVITVVHIGDVEPVRAAAVLAAVVAEHAAVRVWLARARLTEASQDGLAFPPAAPAWRRQEQRFREARTGWLCWWVPTTFISATPITACYKCLL